MISLAPLLLALFSAPASPASAPAPASPGAHPQGGPQWGVSPPSPARTWELGQLGALRLRSELRWGWPSLAGAGFSLSPEPRWIQRFEAKLVRGPLTGVRMEWLTVGASEDPAERWGLGTRRWLRPAPGRATSVLRLAVPIPHTRMELVTQRPVVPARAPFGPGRAAFVSGKF